LRRWIGADLFVAPQRSDWPRALQRARQVGFAALVVQLLIFGWWSHLEASRYALTWDYSLYNQATYLIAHGHLDPYSSTFGFPFWQNDGEFIYWPIAIFERIWPHIVTLKWVQDLAIVAAEAIAFHWICEIAARHSIKSRELLFPVALVAVGLLMLVADPWLTAASSFDVHAEPFIVPFFVAAAHDFYSGRRRAWVWLVFVLAGGAVPCSYAGALGISMALSGRRWWRQGIAVALIGFGWENALHALNAAHGAGVGLLYRQILDGHSGATQVNASVMTLLKAMVEHPDRVVSALWTNKTDIWATISPLGVIGVLWLPALVPALVVLAEGGLTQGFVFSYPGFQNCVLAPIVAVGTVALIVVLATRLGGRRSWLPWLACGVAAINAIVWAAVWLPQTEANWLRVPADSAVVLSSLSSKIGPDDEVIAQQGIVGGFSNRASVYSLLTANSTFPVEAHKVWVIFAPEVGVQTASIAEIYADIAKFSANPAMRLVASKHGIWAYEWTAPAHARTITVGAAGTPYASGPDSAARRAGLGLGPVTRISSVAPGWVASGVEGIPIRKGPRSSWHAASTRTPGYVVNGDYWLEPLGKYTATVSLSVSSAANVEVWDASDSRLLARRVLNDTHGKRTVTLPVRLSNLTTVSLFEGWGLWATVPHGAPAGSDLEIRVWTPGGSDHVNVYSLRIH
jgi:hypothetical protein